jgi:PPE-repeat protein
MDLGALPPEINSARMYFGPGSAPMLAAAAAWGGLADQLQTTAAFYQSIVSGLTEEGWLGPASASMAAAVAPYMAWMSLTGGQADQTAANATAAAGAYEAAYAMTVPPALVAANRGQLMMLVATNVIGQNTAAIAATEAEYGEMWAQDAAAMYGYAAGSAAASELAPFKQPAQVTNPSGQAAQAAAVTQAGGTAGASNVQQSLSQLTSALPNALQSLASPAASASPAAAVPTDLWSFLDSNFANGIISAGYTSPAIIAPGAFAAMADVNAVALGAQESPVPPMGSGEGNEGWQNLPKSRPLVPSGPAGAQVGSTELPSVNLNGFSAGGNQAAMVGRLSVPQSWAAVAQVENHAGVALPGGGWNGNAVPESSAGMPGMPGYPMGRAAGSNWGNGPRYGFRLTVMAHPPAAG